MSCCPTCGATLATKDPTRVEARALAAIWEFHDQHHRFPTYRELSIALGHTSWQAVTPIVRHLARKGWCTLAGVQGKRAIQAARRLTEGVRT